MIQNNIQISGDPAAPPKGLVPFRKFAAALAEFSDFETFRESLSRIVMEDSGYAGILDLDTDLNTITDSQVGDLFTMDSLLMPLGSGEDKGFIRYMGDVNGRPFNAEDLMWVGAITEFVSLAYANARKHRKTQEKGRVFQYLINQLPLAVLCFDAQGEMLVENKMARRLLGDAGVGLIRGALSEKAFKSQGKLRMHLEAKGKLLYAEGRRLDVDDELSVHAFVLHDMSGQREKHLLQLERSLYRSESRQTPLTVAVLEDRSEAGRLYRMLKVSASALQLESDSVLALDAYTSACVFTGKRLRSARYLLKNGLPKPLDRESTRGALIAEWAGLDEARAAQSLIDTACQSMQPLVEMLRPTLLVLDAYPAVLESLEWIGGELASFQPVDEAAKAVALVASGRFDGIFVDVDVFGVDGLDWLQSASGQAGGGFRVFCLSHKQPSMVYRDHGLGEDMIVLQKPFDAEKLRETLALQFDFA